MMPRYHRPAGPSTSRSTVWEYFHYQASRAVGGVGMATCNWCRKTLKAGANYGTSHLWRHVNESCPFLAAVRQQQVGIAAAQPSPLMSVQGHHSTVAIDNLSLPPPPAIAQLSPMSGPVHSMVTADQEYWGCYADLGLPPLTPATTAELSPVTAQGHSTVATNQEHWGFDDLSLPPPSAMLTTDQDYWGCNDIWGPCHDDLGLPPLPPAAAGLSPMSAQLQYSMVTTDQEYWGCHDLGMPPPPAAAELSPMRDQVRYSMATTHQEYWGSSHDHGHVDQCNSYMPQPEIAAPAPADSNEDLFTVLQKWDPFSTGTTDGNGTSNDDTGAN